jgi:hypothetical protein
MAMLYAISDVTGQTVKADAIFNKMRSGLYSCIDCGEQVNFINPVIDNTDKTIDIIRSAHFRHNKGNSCIQNYNSIENNYNMGDRINNEISNKKSTFYKQWTSYFQRDFIEQKITKDGKVRIADVHVKTTENMKVTDFFDLGALPQQPIWTVRDEKGEVFLCSNNIVIQIQHVYLPPHEALCKSLFFTNNGSTVIWLIDSMNSLIDSPSGALRQSLDTYSIFDYTQLVYRTKNNLINYLSTLILENIQMVQALFLHKLRIGYL